MNRLSVRAEGTASAPLHVVWALVADANRYPEWGPWNAGGYAPPGAGPSKPGMTQWFRYGRRTTSRERILEVEDGRRLVYTVERGVPVKNYRAEITLTSIADGTHVSWAAEWDTTVLGRAVHRKLKTLYPEIVVGLLRASEMAVQIK